MRIAATACVASFLLIRCWAIVGGSVSGTVRDATGAVVPDTPVTLCNTDTAVKRTVTTTGDGFFEFTAVPVGRYEIEVVRSGFKRYRHTNVVVDVNSAIQIDVSLELGQASQEVEVPDTAVHVETESSQMGEVIESAKITALPLNGRSFTDLLNLQPGVIPISSTPANAVIMAGVSSFSPSGDLNPGNMSISGQRERSNGFIVNGSDVEEDLNMGTAIIPNLDSIGEFRILTNNFDAEYGNFSGGQIVVVTKSGSNQFHGDAFEFLRDTALDAKGYFSPARAAFDQNQFGGTLGGPIKRQRIFFFSDYQGTRTTQGIETELIPVPSIQDRTGNFSDVASSFTTTEYVNGVPTTVPTTVSGPYWAGLLSQELGYTVTEGESYYVPGCAVPSQCVFPNAVIPQKAWSAPAQHLLQYIPAPNIGTNEFYTSAFDQTVRDDKGAIRLDASTTRWGMLSAYYFVDDYTLNNPYPTGEGGANVPGFNAISNGRAQLISFGDTKQFGSASVNEFHFSFMRDATDVGYPQGGVGPSLASQGFVTGPGTPGIVPLDPAIEGIENVAFNNYTIGVDITGDIQHNNLFQWLDNYSRVTGTHTLKFGGEFHYDQINTIPDATYNGTFSFAGTETGIDFADFLLGIPSLFTQSDGQGFYTRDRYAGAYAQDTWRVKPRLTFTYGVRWDMIVPWYEKFNQIQTLVPGEQSIVYPGAPLGLVFPTDPGIARGLAPIRPTNFSPRLGLAYSPDFERPMLRKIFGGAGKTSLRAGYGVFYTAFEGLSAGVMYAVPPYGYNAISPAPPLFATPFITAATGVDNGQPYPITFTPYGATASHPDDNVDWTPFIPVSADPAFSPKNRVPYDEQYNLSIQRQFGSDTLLTLSYVGAQAHRLLVLLEANPGNPALCLSVSEPSEVMPGSATCGPFAENGVFTTASGTVINGTRSPLGPDFESDTYQTTIGNSNYNALEVNLRRNGRRSEFLIGYTYSKSMDQSSNIGEEVNPINPSLSRAISAFDMTHVFVASYRYELPFDRLFHRDNRLTQGWNISGTTRFSTGLPVTLYNPYDTSLLGTFSNGVNNNLVDTPNVAPGPLEISTNPRNGKPEFNASLFSLPALGDLGNASRRFFYGPGFSNFDMAVLKVVRLNESKSLEFRVEAFNTFNHAQFYGPASVDGTIGSPNFGKIVSAAAPRLVQVATKFNF